MEARPAAPGQASNGGHEPPSDHKGREHGYKKKVNTFATIDHARAANAPAPVHESSNSRGAPAAHERSDALLLRAETRMGCRNPLPYLPALSCPRSTS